MAWCNSLKLYNLRFKSGIITFFFILVYGVIFGASSTIHERIARNLSKKAEALNKQDDRQ